MKINKLFFCLQVPGSLIISARSDAHSFDGSQMNMSHVIHHLSFGRKILPRVMSDVKRILPYVGMNHDRLNGRAFTNNRDIGNVTVSLTPLLILLVQLILLLKSLVTY